MPLPLFLSYFSPDSFPAALGGKTLSEKFANLSLFCSSDLSGSQGKQNTFWLNNTCFFCVCISLPASKSVPSALVVR